MSDDTTKEEPIASPPASLPGKDVPEASEAEPTPAVEPKEIFEPAPEAVVEVIETKTSELEEVQNNVDVEAIHELPLQTEKPAEGEVIPTPTPSPPEEENKAESTPLPVTPAEENPPPRQTEAPPLEKGEYTPPSKGSTPQGAGGGVQPPPVSAPSPVERVPLDSPSTRLGTGARDRPINSVLGFLEKLKLLRTKANKKRQENKDKNLAIVLKYAQEHNRITNDEVEKITGVKHAQATRYLNKLVKTQKLMRFGTKSNIFYKPIK